MSLWTSRLAYTSTTRFTLCVGADQTSTGAYPAWIYIQLGHIPRTGCFSYGYNKRISRHRQFWMQPQMAHCSTVSSYMMGRDMEWPVRMPLWNRRSCSRPAHYADHVSTLNTQCTVMFAHGGGVEGYGRLIFWPVKIRVVVRAVLTCSRSPGRDPI